ncbi:hypothetical protein CLV84_3681 [Neolewinella xylanilytica]|uniref:Uncharacterized protein n=1 Tax=Neolewinella xylanilytica TaxID=1514080 RepID=A0A2S6I0X1_9BACT|nr:hypothetical protein [Neolewinella xylanilytica]PPK84521.1 hypothetical protein CLV84_3681 [Neolewinella xylanilytica]
MQLSFLLSLLSTLLIGTGSLLRVEVAGTHGLSDALLIAGLVSLVLAIIALYYRTPAEEPV